MTVIQSLITITKKAITITQSAISIATKRMLITPRRGTNIFRPTRLHQALFQFADEGFCFIAAEGVGGGAEFVDDFLVAEIEKRSLRCGSATTGTHRGFVECALSLRRGGTRRRIRRASRG